MKMMVTQMAKAEGVTERLKAESQMEWVQRMNSTEPRRRNHSGRIDL